MSEGQASFRDELQVVILYVSSKWFDGRINLSSHWSHSTSGLHQSHIRFDNFLFELAAVSPVLLEPWNTCESLPLRAFLRPPRFVGKIYGGEEDKTKSLSVNPFRSRGFPWSGQKGATWGDLQRKGREPITYLTLHPYAGELELLPTHQTLHKLTMTLHSSGSYTNNNYSLSGGPLVLTQLQWIACALRVGAKLCMQLASKLLLLRAGCILLPSTHVQRIILPPPLFSEGHYLPSSAKLPHLNNALKG